jgi:putative glutamine amidotransferase
MIGITKCERDFDKYLIWLDYFNARYCVLDYMDAKALKKFDVCTGLILTGGVDIYPELYNDWETAEDKGKFLPERDGFELKILSIAVEKGIPVLGICRGCQLINVFFRGSLIYDLETIRKVNHRKLNSKQQRMHEITVSPDSLLMDIVKISIGEVTSSHHQAVDRAGEGLKVSAKAPDGIIEAIEYGEFSKKHFLLGIQWHPERFENFDNELSKNIILRFIMETN